MLSRKLLILLLLLLPATNSHAQEAADIISWGTVISNVTVDTISAFRSDDKVQAFKTEGIRIGIVVGASEILKRIIHETRPDKSDNKSFPSEHSALACVAIDFNSDAPKLSVQISGAITTMIGRIKAQKHFWWDTLAGCGIGLAVSQIR